MDLRIKLLTEVTFWQPRIDGARYNSEIMATEQMEDSWVRIKTQIQVFWGEFDEKDMKKARGNLPRMVTLIHEKTGEDKNSIIQKISTIV